MNDADVLNHIENLVAEEHRLLESAGDGRPPDDAARARLEEVRVQLDRTWDLLRRRRAREEFGLSPDAEPGSAEDIVERYQP
jgi:hypothetical protein